MTAPSMNSRWGKPVAHSRAPRRGSEPLVSVAVASNRRLALLDDCLGSLLGQCEAMKAELIVARAGQPDEVTGLSSRYPTVRFVAAPVDATIPELRALAMSRATGDIVALTEDHCVADEHWVESLARSASGGADVVGGGMENARRSRAVDWAAYFAEYGFFASNRPDAGDGAPLLTGANVAYTRAVVDDVIEWAKAGEWENVAHERLIARGSILRFARTAAIYQNQTYSVRAFCVDRYEHGRDYARKRLVEQGGSRRWLLLAASPVLPFFLTWRVARAAARSRVSTFARALPATFLFLTAWSIGEATGYVLGPPEANDQA